MKKSLSSTSLLLISAIAASQSVWTVVNLHPEGQVSSTAMAVRNGRQVGFVGNSGRAALWNGSSAWVDLTPPGETSAYAMAMSEFQQAGYAGQHARIWYGSSNPSGNLNPSGASRSAVNDTDGTTQVGSATIASGTVAAMWKGTSESFVNLAPPNSYFSVARCGNSAIQGGEASIHGYSRNRAGIWRGTGSSWVDITPANAASAAVNALHGSTQVGMASYSTGFHAGLWRGTKGSWVDLHPSGQKNSSALGVFGEYQAGWVALDEYNVDQRAALWRGTPSSFTDLHALLEAQIPGTVFTQSFAHDVWVDPAGNIHVVGGGLNQSTGQYQALLWTKAPPVVHVEGEINGTPLPPEILPSVYRLSNTTGYATPKVLQVVKVKFRSPLNPFRNLRVWVHSDLLSGGHWHGPAVRPSGYLVNVAQLADLRSAWQTAPNDDFVGGAFNVSSATDYMVSYTALQRSVSNSVPTNSYSNGVNVALNALGEGDIYYVAPEIAGMERIIASTIASSADLRRVDELPITLRYPGLVYVPASSALEHVAANAPGHHLLGGIQGNYHTTPNGKIALESLAAQFFSDTGTKLRLNDCSLMWGGMFDDNCKFVYPVHFGHRDGAEYDLGLGGLLGGTYPNPKIERILVEHPYWAVTPTLWASENTSGQPHYHVRLLPASSWRTGPSVQQFSPAYPKIEGWIPSNRSRNVRIKLTNRGPYRASQISIASATATLGATATWTPPTTFALDPRKQSSEFTIVVSGIPTGGTTLTIRGSAVDATGTRPLQRLVAGSPPTLVSDLVIPVPGP